MKFSLSFRVLSYVVLGALSPLSAAYYAPPVPYYGGPFVPSMVPEQKISVTVEDDGNGNPATLLLGNSFGFTMQGGIVPEQLRIFLNRNPENFPSHTWRDIFLNRHGEGANGFYYITITQESPLLPYYVYSGSYECLGAKRVTLRVTNPFFSVVPAKASAPEIPYMPYPVMYPEPARIQAPSFPGYYQGSAPAYSGTRSHVPSTTHEHSLSAEKKLTSITNELASLKTHMKSLTTQSKSDITNRQLLKRIRSLEKLLKKQVVPVPSKGAACAQEPLKEEVSEQTYSLKDSAIVAAQVVSENPFAHLSLFASLRGSDIPSDPQAVIELAVPLQEKEVIGSSLSLLPQEACASPDVELQMAQLAVVGKEEVNPLVSLLVCLEEQQVAVALSISPSPLSENQMKESKKEVVVEDVVVKDEQQSKRTTHVGLKQPSQKELAALKKQREQEVREQEVERRKIQAAADKVRAQQEREQKEREQKEALKKEQSNQKEALPKQSREEKARKAAARKAQKEAEQRNREEGDEKELQLAKEERARELKKAADKVQKDAKEAEGKNRQAMAEKAKRLAEEARVQELKKEADEKSRQARVEREKAQAQEIRKQHLLEAILITRLDEKYIEVLSLTEDKLVSDDSQAILARAEALTNLRLAESDQATPERIDAIKQKLMGIIQYGGNHYLDDLDREYALTALHDLFPNEEINIERK